MKNNYSEFFNQAYEIKSISNKDFGESVANCKFYNTNNEKVLNLEKLHDTVIIKCITYPNLQDIELMSRLHVHSSSELLNKIFTLDEKKLLYNEICELSGFEPIDMPLLNTEEAYWASN